MPLNISALLRSILWFLLAAILLAAAIAVGYALLPNLAGSPQPSPTPPILAASAPTPAIPAGWKTYTDPDAGFSFSYPPDAVLETGSNELHPFNFIRLVFTERDQASLIVDVRPNPSKSTPAELAAQLYQEAAGQAAPKTLSSSPESVLVGSALAEKFVLPPTLTQYMLFLPRNDKMMVIYPGGVDAPATATPPALDRFNQVLASFTFQNR